MYERTIGLLCIGPTTPDNNILQSITMTNGNNSGRSNGGSFHSERRRSATTMDDSANPQAAFKRQRTALACNSCRNRKSRCNGSRPRCTMCVEMGLECVYQQPGQQPRKENKVEVEGRLSSIEQTLQLLVEEHRRNNRESQLGVNGDAQFVRHIDIDSHNGTPLVDAPAEDTVDGMGAITFADEHESGFFGPSSNIAFMGQITTAISAAAGSGATILPPAGEDRVEGGLTSVSRPASPLMYTRTAADGLADTADIYALPAEADMLHLIRLFFNDTGMLFPYINEKSLLDEVYSVKQSNFATARRSWLCLLNMVLAFATCISARPDRPVEQNAAESNVYFKRAQALSGNMASKTVNVEIVQYLLLMTQYLQGIQRSAQTWKLHGLAIRAALQLGLHTAGPSTMFTPLESEIRKRTWYGCVLLDRTLSMTFGRPPAIPNQYVKIDLPLNVDLSAFGPDGALPSPSSSDASTVAFFNGTITLHEVLGEIIDRQYGQNFGVSPQATLSCLLESTIKLEGQLLAWKQKLPHVLRLRTWNSSTVSAENSHYRASGVNAADNMVFERLSVIMNLRYLNVRALLHRPILVRFLEQTHLPSLDQEEARFLRQFGYPSLEACLESAAEIITIVHNFKDTPVMLGAWWFSTYYTFNAALIIFSGLLIQANSATTNTTGYLGPKDLQTSLHLAVEALHSLGDGARLVRRCRKFLEILMQTITRIALGNPQAQARWSHIIPTGGSEGQLHGAMDNNMSTHSASELSPLGLELGEFLNEDHFDVLNRLLASAPDCIDANGQVF